MSKQAEQPANIPKTYFVKSFLLFTLMLCVGAVAVLVVLRLVDSDQRRALFHWQARLSLTADHRLESVEKWVEGQYATLLSLAENASLQMYLHEIESIKGAATSANSGRMQKTFLRNLLQVTAQRNGFELTSNVPIEANVERVGGAGIAIVDNKGKVIAGTSTMPPLEGKLTEFLQNVGAGERGLLDLFVGADGRPAMAFSVPVFGIQSDNLPSEQIGRIIGVKHVEGDLFPLLDHANAPERTIETMLIRLEGNTIFYLTPLMDGSQAMKRKFAQDTPDLASNYVINTLGGFAEKRDYRFKEVLVTGRQVVGTPWYLVQKIDREEALEASLSRRGHIYLISGLSIAVLLIFMIAVWRHGSSVRAERAKVHFRDIARKYEQQERLLRIVTDNQPSSMFIADSENRYCFINAKAAEQVDMQPKHMLGKTLTSVLGSDTAVKYTSLNHNALAEKEVLSMTHRIGEGDDEKVILSQHIPLEKMVIPPARKAKSCVLVTEEDITDAIKERELRLRILKELVETLVNVVDRRDPYAANHSVRVAKIAKAIAEEMDLGSVMVETAEIAGNLMNVGKILVPVDILTHKKRLNDDQLRLVRESIYTSADLIEGIEFDGQVEETLRQSQENWDGTGPEGLKGEDIIMTARIIAVANAFVGMISKRSYREGLSVDDTLENLMQEIGKQFDRAVVTALVSYLDNRVKRENWDTFFESDDLRVA